MANPVVIIVTNAKVMLGDTQADVTPGTGTGDAFECQVTSAAINATPNLQQVPATFCAPASQAPAATSFELALTWLQDWTVADGLSMWAFTNDTLTKWFSLTLEGATEPSAVGEVRVVAGSYGGDAGTPLTATQTWPCVNKPTITPGSVVLPLAAPEAASEPESVPA